MGGGAVEPIPCLMRRMATSTESVSMSSSKSAEADGAFGDQRLVGKPAQRRPEPCAHGHNREAVDLLALDEGEGFKSLVQGAKAARHHHESGRVFHQHDLADEEMANLDEPIQVAVFFLFERQGDVAAQAGAARLAGSAVGGFHDTGAATGHHGESLFGQPSAQRPRHAVVGM